MRVLGQEVRGLCIHIGEIAAPTARNADFLACFLGVIHNKYPSTRVGGTHQARGACANDDRIPIHIGGVPLSWRESKGFNWIDSGNLVKVLFTDPAKGRFLRQFGSFS